VASRGAGGTFSRTPRPTARPQSCWPAPVIPTGRLIWDGLRPGVDGHTQFEKTIYTYCQGVVLGAELELTPIPAHQERIHRLVAAIDTRLTNSGVLTGHRDGDSGLFSGILARYLALVAVELPGDKPADEATRATARGLVLTSADAAWRNAATHQNLPVFGPDWSRPAVVPTRGRKDPERDLSVQLSGWMLLEAAYRVAGGAQGEID
jgi:predicted alpha-1,6-mannanase (GH76 family)